MTYSQMVFLIASYDWVVSGKMCVLAREEKELMKKLKF